VCVKSQFERQAFVHLAYMDETGTDGHCPVVMFGALIVPVGKFGRLAHMHSAAIQQILPVEMMDQFIEFHACELYRGTGIFAGVDENKRFNAIQLLLHAVQFEELSFIYSAVDRKKFEASPFGSGRPLHVAFHLCLLGVEDWATANHPNYPGGKTVEWNDTYLCILDDCDNTKLKEEFRKTYRILRAKHLFMPQVGNKLWHAHDDMFFADSKSCLGIQIVDLCNYFVRLHLTGEPEPQGFYQQISERVICARPSPEWSQYGQLLRDHEGG
jgi:hypothetical protein